MKQFESETASETGVRNMATQPCILLSLSFEGFSYFFFSEKKLLPQTIEGYRSSLFIYLGKVLGNVHFYTYFKCNIPYHMKTLG